MERSLNVLLISSVPIDAAALQQALGATAPAASFQTITDPDLAPVHLDPDVVVIAPQTWEELQGWLPPLQRRFTARRWLIFCRIRIAGLFADRLPRRHCTIVLPAAAPEALAAAFNALVRGEALFPPDALRSRFDAGIAPLLGQYHCGPITLRLLAYACGVSLGLGTRRLGQVLGVAEGTVQDQISVLLHQYHQSDREALGLLVERALTC